MEEKESEEILTWYDVWAIRVITPFLCLFARFWKAVGGNQEES